MNDLIKKAMIFANHAHMGQMYGDVYPYSNTISEFINR